jgi:hypothetical protein
MKTTVGEAGLRVKIFQLRPPEDTDKNHANNKNKNGKNRFMAHFASALISTLQQRMLELLTHYELERI